MGTSDRIKDSLAALGRASVPGIDYLTTYRARVITQPPGSQTVDVQPADPRLPNMSAVPIRWGLPGVKATMIPGGTVLIGWENGDPRQPYAALPDGSESVVIVSLEAGKVNLGAATLVPIMDGVVHGQGVDPFTGAPYFALGNTSTVVSAKR